MQGWGLWLGAGPGLCRPVLGWGRVLIGCGRVFSARVRVVWRAGRVVAGRNVDEEWGRGDDEGLEEAEEEEEEEMRMGVVDRTGSTGGLLASCVVTDSFSGDVGHCDTPVPTGVPAEVFHPGGDRGALEDGLGSVRKAGGHPATG